MAAASISCKTRLLLIRYLAYLLLLALIAPVRCFSQEQSRTAPTINIGLLVPDTSCKQAIYGAEEAVYKANKQGGFQNREFRLVVRSTEGPWGTGSKESVALVYEDNVCAIVGFLDGRNAHLTEQVAAKSHLSYIEAYATEPTLSQAYVPWFMRVVPNDDQQARALKELIKKNGEGKIGILSTEAYDTQYALKSLKKSLSPETGETVSVIDIDNLKGQKQKIIEEIRSRSIRHLILPFDPALNREVLLAMRKELPSLQLYGTMHFTMEAERRPIPWKYYEGMYVISAGPLWFQGRGGISSDYIFPNSRYASVQTAVSLVIEAIQEVGTDREAIKSYLLEMDTFAGLTGPVSFDKNGNLNSAPKVARIIQGKFEPVLYKENR